MTGPRKSTSRVRRAIVHEATPQIPPALRPRPRAELDERRLASFLQRPRAWKST